MSAERSSAASGPAVAAGPPSAAAQRTADERRDALRALLREPFVGPPDPAFRFVRRHEGALARLASDLLGYRLEVMPGFARLLKRPTAKGLRRPPRIPPGTPSGRARPRDEWPALDRHRATLLLLVASALERRPGAQVVVGDLVRGVAEAGARCEPPLTLDFERRAERIAFADALDLLCHWGLLRVDDGSRASFSRREQGEDEALFTIDRKRLASLLRDPARALAAGSVADLIDDGGDYAPTDEGRARRLRHRLARMLAEDPVLYVDELTEEEHAYFRRQRGYLEERVGAATGLVPERRAEGTTCVERERWLTDLPFPARSARKQAALILCDELARRLAAGEAELTRAQLRAWVRGLLERHGDSLGRSPDDPAEVDELAAAALDVLVGVGAAAPTAAGGARALPLCARFREPALRFAGEAE